jgi:hypothetical protein
MVQRSNEHFLLARHDAATSKLASDRRDQEEPHESSHQASALSARDAVRVFSRCCAHVISKVAAVRVASVLRRSSASDLSVAENLSSDHALIQWFVSFFCFSLSLFLIESEFKIFRSGSAFTVYLEPEVNPPGALVRLHEALCLAFPECARESRSFEAHIGVGFFTKQAEAEMCHRKYQSEWKPFKYVIKELYLMHHEQHDSPFSIAEIAPISGNNAPAHFNIGDNTFTVLNKF